MDNSKLQSSPYYARVNFSQNVNRARPVTARPVMLNIPAHIISPESQPEVDLRPEIASFNIPVRNQGTRGTGSVFAITFLLEYMYAKYYGMKNADLSEEFLNYASNFTIGEKTDGGFLDDIDLGYQKFGVVSETLAPYQTAFDSNINYDPATKAKASLMPRLTAHFIKTWNIEAGLLSNQLLAIAFHLKSGRPVAAGLRWPKENKFKIEKIQGVTMMTAPERGDVVDGHAIVFVGYKVSDKFPGGGYLVFRNHWGTAFMDSGYGYMAFDYASKYTNDLVQYTAG